MSGPVTPTNSNYYGNSGVPDKKNPIGKLDNRVVRQIPPANDNNAINCFRSRIRQRNEQVPPHNTQSSNESIPKKTAISQIPTSVRKDAGPSKKAKKTAKKTDKVIPQKILNSNPKQNLPENGPGIFNLLSSLIDKKDPKNTDEIDRDKKLRSQGLGFRFIKEGNEITIDEQGKKILANNGIDVDNLPKKAPDGASPALKNFIEAFGGCTFKVVDEKTFEAKLKELFEEQKVPNGRSPIEELERLSGALTSHLEQLGKEGKEKKVNVEGQRKESMKGKDIAEAKAKMEEDAQRNAAKERKEEEIIYRALVKLMNYLTKELRKGEIKEWNKHKEDLKSELQTKRVCQEAAEQGIIDRAIVLMESASDSDPLFTCMVLSVFKVSCSSLPTGLPFAGCYSAERAEKGAIKRVGMFTRKDFERLQGIDRVFKNNQSDLEEVRDKYDFSLEKAEAFRIQREADQNRVSSGEEALLTEEQKGTVYQPLEEEELRVSGAIVSAGVNKIAFLHRPVSDGKKMREWANKTLLPNHVDVEKLHADLLQNHVHFDLERLGKLTSSIGDVRTLLEQERHRIWKNKKVIKIM